MVIDSSFCMASPLDFSRSLALIGFTLAANLSSASRRFLSANADAPGFFKHGRTGDEAVVEVT